MFTIVLPAMFEDQVRAAGSPYPRNAVVPTFEESVELLLVSPRQDQGKYCARLRELRGQGVLYRKPPNVRGKRWSLELCDEDKPFGLPSSVVN
jgi:hypothetical protein